MFKNNTKAIAISLLVTSFLAACTASNGNFSEEDEREIKVKGLTDHSLNSTNIDQWAFEVSEIRHNGTKIYEHIWYKPIHYFATGPGVYEVDVTCYYRLARDVNTKHYASTQTHTVDLSLYPSATFLIESSSRKCSSSPKLGGI